MTLTQLSLTEQARMVRAGEVSARELVSAHLDRCEELQPLLNAFTFIDRHQALLTAEQLDRRMAAGEAPGPLAGVPVAVKDLIDQKGIPTTCGSSFYREVPKQSAPAVNRLVAAGAVIVGRTGLHEFAFGFSSENHWWGPVRNPWDQHTSPGGSSGGSAVAVAAGMAAGALGTDTGGSIRVPAALCGLVGLKVTHGRVPLTGVFPLVPSADTVGPITRTVSDAALLYQIMAGHDFSDPHAAIQPVVAPAGPADLTNLTVGVPHPWVDHRIEQRLRRAFEDALDRLTAAGVDIRQIDAPLLDPPGRMAGVIAGEVSVVHREWFPSRADEYGPEVADRLSAAMSLTVAESVAAQEWRSDLRRAAAEVFQEVDFLATPAVAAARKTIGVNEVDIDGSPMPYRPALSNYAALVNHFDAPALVVPLSQSGAPPPSLQIIGPEWSEHRLLEIGLALEEAGISGFSPPPLW